MTQHEGAAGLRGEDKPLKILSVKEFRLGPACRGGRRLGLLPARRGGVLLG